MKERGCYLGGGGGTKKVFSGWGPRRGFGALGSSWTKRGAKRGGPILKAIMKGGEPFTGKGIFSFKILMGNSRKECVFLARKNYFFNGGKKKKGAVQKRG